MRKIVFLLTALCLSMSAWSQDGLVYWSQADGYKFDFDLDGTVDFSLPTQTTDKAISQVFVFDGAVGVVTALHGVYFLII